MSSDFEFLGTVLLQPSSVLAQREVNVSDMGEYINRVASSVSAGLLAVNSEPAAGHIVIAVRSGYRVKVWLDFDVTLGSGFEEVLIKAVNDIKPFEVSEGAIIFSMLSEVNGAKLVMGDDESPPLPSPEQWRSLAKDILAPLSIEQVVNLLWP